MDVDPSQGMSCLSGAGQGRQRSCSLQFHYHQTTSPETNAQKHLNLQ